MKKILSIVISLMIMMSMFSGAFADGEATASEPVIIVTTDAPAVEPASEEAVEEVPAEEAPAAEEAAEEVPAEEAPAAEEAVEEVPAEEAPAAEEVVEEIPAEEVPAEEVVEEIPAEEIPAEEAVEEVPAEEVPAEEATYAEAPVEEIPAEEATEAEAPVQEATSEEATEAEAVEIIPEATEEEAEEATAEEAEEEGFEVTIRVAGSVAGTYEYVTVFVTAKTSVSLIAIEGDMALVNIGGVVGHVSIGTAMKLRLVTADDLKEEEAPEATEEEAEVIIPEATEEEAEVIIPEATEEEAEVIIPEATEEEAEVIIPEATEEEAEVIIPEATEEEAEVVLPEATEEEAEEIIPEATEEEAEVIVPAVPEDQPAAEETPTEIPEEIIEVDVRLEGDGLSEIVLTVTPDAEITVLSVEGDWVEVQIGEQIGYIFKADAVKMGLIEAEEETEVQPKLTIFSSRRSVMEPGEIVFLTSLLEGLDGYTISYQWQWDRGNGFENIAGATSDSFAFEASVETLAYNWRLIVYFE